MRKRIMIIGQPGSGKTTLATKLGDRLRLPVYHIDRIHWDSGWKERSSSEKTKLCSQVHAKEEWIFEGGHSSTWQERLERADTLIWLDLPWMLRVASVAWRELQSQGQSRPDMPSDCPGGFDTRFFRFLGYIWRTRNTQREKMQRFYENAPASKELYRFYTRLQVNRFASSIVP